MICQTYRMFIYNEIREFGSQTSLSAEKGVNQRVLYPFLHPKNLLQFYLVVFTTHIIKEGRKQI